VTIALDVNLSKFPFEEEVDKEELTDNPELSIVVAVGVDVGAVRMSKWDVGMCDMRSCELRECVLPPPTDNSALSIMRDL